jgi:hypothetical protein
MSASLSPTGTADTITTPTAPPACTTHEQDEDDPMAEDRRSPTARRRRLSAELESLIKGAELDAVQVDDRLEWTRGKTAKMLRGAWKLPSLRDIRDILDLLKVPDGDPHRDYLLTLARQGRERDWWHPYREMLSETFTTYLGLETEASSVYTFEQGVFPGLTQTPDYARAVMLDGPDELTAQAIEERLKVRLERQKLLTGTDPLRLWAVLDEAVLRREVGGRDVMAAQFRHILQLAELPRVTFQIVPFSKGAHPGVSGPFTILEFPEPASPDTAYTESLAGELVLEKPHDVGRFKLALERLRSIALSPRDSLEMLAAEAAET